MQTPSFEEWVVPDSQPEMDKNAVNIMDCDDEQSNCLQVPEKGLHQALMLHSWHWQPSSWS